MKALKIGAGVAAVGIALVGAVSLASPDSSSSAGAATDAVAKQTVKVTRRDLVSTTTIEGTVTYGTPTTVRLTGSSTSSSSATSSASGGGASPGGAATATTATATPNDIVTALPVLGQVITRGAPLYEVNGAVGPVLLFGTRPAWRDLSTSSADGVDILQLEENLAAMGFTHNGTLVVDDDYTSATSASVKDWQEALGVEETGTVAAEDIWYGPGDVRVASLTGSLGDSASSSVMTVTGTQQLVHVDLEVANVAYVKAGQSLMVTLADDSSVEGKVVSLSKAATTSTTGGGGGAAATTTTTVSMDIRLNSETKNVVEASSVSIDLVTSSVDNALTVPTSALLALAEGGYAIEKSDGQLVAITPGKYADGFVEISGEVAEGDVVVTA